MRQLLYSVIVLLAVTTAACDVIYRVSATSENEIDTVLVERGIDIYRQNYCGSCHTLSVANTRGTFGPVHDNIASIATDYVTLDSYTGAADSVAAYIRESILAPAVYYTPGYEFTHHSMPAFTHLPEADIDALVYMLMNQPSAVSGSVQE